MNEWSNVRMTLKAFSSISLNVGLLTKGENINCNVLFQLQLAISPHFYSASSESLKFHFQNYFRCTEDWRKIICLKSQFLVDFQFSCSHDFDTNGCSWFCFNKKHMKIMNFRKNCLHPIGRIHWVWQWNLLN